MSPLANNKKLSLYTLILAVIFSLSSLYFFIVSNYANSYSLIAFLIWIPIGITLIYISFCDIKTLSFPFLPALVLLVSIIATNLLLALFKINKVLILKDYYYLPLVNLLTGILLGLVLYIIVKATKEKYLGEGDVYLFALLGSILGLKSLVLAFYIIIISSTIFALMQVAKLKRIKDIKVPFVPFIALGIILSPFLFETYQRILHLIFI